MAVSPFAWRPCCLRTIQRPLAASPSGRLSRPRSTISQSDCRRAIGPFSPFRLGRPYKRSLEPDGSPLFTRNLWTACRRYEPRKHLKTLAMARREILRQLRAGLPLNRAIFWEHEASCRWETYRLSSRCNCPDRTAGSTIHIGDDLGAAENVAKCAGGLSAHSALVLRGTDCACQRLHHKRTSEQSRELSKNT